MRTRMLLPALLAAVALLGAACSGEADIDTDGDGVEVTVDADTPDDNGDDGGSTSVEMTDFEFSPADPSVSSGGTIALDNVGEAPHTFTIEAEGIDEEVAAGESAEVTIDLDAGTYDFVCTFHESQGMVGTLTVT